MKSLPPAFADSTPASCRIRLSATTRRTATGFGGIWLLSQVLQTAVEPLAENKYRVRASVLSAVAKSAPSRRSSTRLRFGFALAQAALVVFGLLGLTAGAAAMAGVSVRSVPRHVVDTLLEPLPPLAENLQGSIMLGPGAEVSAEDSGGSGGPDNSPVRAAPPKTMPSPSEASLRSARKLSRIRPCKAILPARLIHLETRRRAHHPRSTQPTANRTGSGAICRVKTRQGTMATRRGTEAIRRATTATRRATAATGAAGRTATASRQRQRPVDNGDGSGGGSNGGGSNGGGSNGDGSNGGGSNGGGSNGGGSNAGSTNGSNDGESSRHGTSGGGSNDGTMAVVRRRVELRWV